MEQIAARTTDVRDCEQRVRYVLSQRQCPQQPPLLQRAHLGPQLRVPVLRLLPLLYGVYSEIRNQLAIVTRLCNKPCPQTGSIGSQVILRTPKPSPTKSCFSNPVQ